MTTATLSIVYDQPIAMTHTTAPAWFADLYERHYDAVFRAALHFGEVEESLKNQKVHARILERICSAM